MLHRPSRGASRRLEPPPEPSPTSGHDRRCYTTARDTIGPRGSLSTSRRTDPDAPLTSLGALLVPRIDPSHVRADQTARQWRPSIPASARRRAASQDVGQQPEATEPAPGAHEETLVRSIQIKLVLLDAILHLTAHGKRCARKATGRLILSADSEATVKPVSRTSPGARPCPPRGACDQLSMVR
jgi:hypothetical protein